MFSSLSNENGFCDSVYGLFASIRFQFSYQSAEHKAEYGLVCL